MAGPSKFRLFESSGDNARRYIYSQNHIQGPPLRAPKNRFFQLLGLVSKTTVLRGAPNNIATLKNYLFVSGPWTHTYIPP